MTADEFAANLDAGIPAGARVPAATRQVHQLVDVVIDRIDLVDTPANPHASVLLFKRDDGPPAEEMGPLPIPNSLRGLMTARKEGKPLYIEDRHDLKEWAKALPRGVNVGEIGGVTDVYVGPLQRVPSVSDDDVLWIAKHLPVDCVRHVLLTKGRQQARV